MFFIITIDMTDPQNRRCHNDSDEPNAGEKRHPEAEVNRY